MSSKIPAQGRSSQPRILHAKRCTLRVVDSGLYLFHLVYVRSALHPETPRLHLLQAEISTERAINDPIISSYVTFGRQVCQSSRCLFNITTLSSFMLKPAFLLCSTIEQGRENT